MNDTDFEREIQAHYKGLWEIIAYKPLSTAQMKKIINILYTIDKELGRVKNDNPLIWPYEK